jgi:hypothetical protein
MPTVYFNPYPGPAIDSEAGQMALIAAARSVYAVKQHFDQAVNPTGDFPIGTFVLYKDHRSGAQYTIPGSIYSLKGRDRELVRYFLNLFDKGQVLTSQELGVCEDWVLNNIGAAVPVLEYAARNNGMAATIATELEWACDFLEFGANNVLLPNIWGQEKLDSICEWVHGWHQGYSDHITRLVRMYGLTICEGALKQYAPALSEYEK